MTDTAQLALDTLQQKPAKGIPIWQINPMEWSVIDRIAGEPEGTYKRSPVSTYLKMLTGAGCCLLDQWIPENPLTMGASGYESGKPRGATTGAKTISKDGLIIDSPEAVVEHLEKFEFPSLLAAIENFDEEKWAEKWLGEEQSVQEILGPSVLKTSHGSVDFPKFRYSRYGYENYFMAYALFPDVIERDFRLQADLAVLRNRAFVRASEKGHLPPLNRLDHDMADSRGTLVDIKSLDRIWLPQFARSVEPVVKGGIRMIWHCDGNLSAMVPRLLESGLHGFQGFQYENGMDYESICRMKTRDKQPLIIIAGVSVTQTLVHGMPKDVRNEMRWLVEKGPRTGLFLGGSSSITPGTPWSNLEALVEGFHYYRDKGRG